MSVRLESACIILLSEERRVIPFWNLDVITTPPSPCESWLLIRINSESPHKPDVYY